LDRILKWTGLTGFSGLTGFILFYLFDFFCWNSSLVRMECYVNAEKFYSIT
jgi:hypothetical protein